MHLFSAHPLRVSPLGSRWVSTIRIRRFTLAPPSYRRATMPKDTQTGPVSALFGVVKPSGPTSMSLVNDVKKLVANSPLFVEASKLAEKSKRGRKGKSGRDVVKIGQGGTLDPLADGVLGESLRSSQRRARFEGTSSRWGRKRYEKAGRLPRLREGNKSLRPTLPERAVDEYPARNIARHVYWAAKPTHTTAKESRCAPHLGITSRASKWRRRWNSSEARLSRFRQCTCTRAASRRPKCAILSPFT